MQSVEITEVALTAGIHTVLVVEDEILIRIVLAEYLRECGLRVVEAGTGEEAIKVLSEGDTSIDVVFSDVQMPGTITGFGLARWIRANKPGLPIVLTSGNTRMADNARDICHQGELVAKPYDHELLLQRLRQLLAGKDNSSAPRVIGST